MYDSMFATWKPLSVNSCYTSKRTRYATAVGEIIEVGICYSYAALGEQVKLTHRVRDNGPALF
jgi:hypothetical protein